MILNIYLLTIGYLAGMALLSAIAARTMKPDVRMKGKIEDLVKLSNILVDKPKLIKFVTFSLKHKYLYMALCILMPVLNVPITSLGFLNILGMSRKER